MRTHDDPEILGIGERIRKAAKALREYQSHRSSSGVNIAKLAKLIGASNEMTRRYVEGNAQIPADKIRHLAKSLEVSLLWLSHGEGPMKPAIIDAHTLEDCLNSILEAEEKSGIKMSNVDKSKLAAELYSQSIEGLQNRADILAAAFRITRPEKP